MLEEYVWAEKYRPKTIKDTILVPHLKQMFQEFIELGNVPNLLLTGPAGCGKTTVARAMLEELGCDYIVINGSLNGNIDTLRFEIMSFASSVSLTGGRKYVILDEADHLNPNSFQPALRNFMEEFSKNCGFILTCNYKNRIIEPLHSRCAVVDFNIKKVDLPVLAAQILKRLQFILTQENIAFDKAVLAALIKNHCPDWRRIINELQRYSSSGTIDSGILARFTGDSYKKLISYLKERDFTSMRRWVAENIEVDTQSMFRLLYDTASEVMEKKSIPQLVLILARYQYQAAFVADAEVNLVAALVEIMIECEFQ